jgi:hypothetical protein
MVSRKIATSIAVMSLVFVAAAPAASASGSDDDHDRSSAVEQIEVGFFYGSDGYTLFSGAAPSDFCTENFTMAKAKVSERRDGTFTVKAKGHNIPMYLFDFGGPAPALIDMACEALFDDDPSTNPLEPIAVGSGRVKIKDTGLAEFGATAGFHSFNVSRGTVRGEDGSKWRVRAWADLDIDENGFPVGNPAEFQSLSVKQVRRGR